jgi:UDP-4-amino-4,6-dideoxy-N-acetyl-beta-L-altrosamine N-acetyltransferase
MGAIQVMDLHKNMVVGDLLLCTFLNLAPEEIEMVRKWRNHEAIREWMYGNDIISREEHRAFIEGLKSDYRNFYWLVKNQAGYYLGVIDLKRVDLANRNAYLGIYANPESDDRGRGHILMDCLKRLAFDVINLHVLKLEVIAENSRAIDFYRREGFQEEGRLKEFVFKGDRWLDVMVMGIMNT